MSTEDDPPIDSSEEYEQLAASAGEDRYVLRLYVTGLTPRSTNALANLQVICEKHLRGRYDLEVIDIYKQPQLASGEQIIATPTLIKQLPAPLRRIVGDLSNEERVLFGLDLRKD